MRIIKNPSTGRLINRGSAVAINSNINFVFSKKLSRITYKGAEGSIITDGAYYVTRFFNTSAENIFTIVTEIPEGSSIDFN